MGFDDPFEHVCATFRNSEDALNVAQAVTGIVQWMASARELLADIRTMAGADQGVAEAIKAYAVPINSADWGEWEARCFDALLSHQRDALAWLRVNAAEARGTGRAQA